MADRFRSALGFMCRATHEAVQMKATSANLAHPLDGGIPFLLHIGRHLPAASDEQR